MKKKIAQGFRKIAPEFERLHNVGMDKLSTVFTMLHSR